MSAIDIAAMLFLGAVWGGSYLFIRVAVPDLGPLPLAAARVAVASVILVLVPSIRRDLPLLRKRAGALLLLGATNAAIPYALIAAAEIRVTASLAAILGATIPLCTSVWAAVSLGQRITGRQAAGLALGLAGVVGLVGWSPMPLTPITLLAVAAILVASVSYGYANVYIKRRLSGVPPRALALGQQLGGAAWLLVPAAVAAPAVHLTATSAAALLRAGYALHGGGVSGVFPVDRARRPDPNVHGGLPDPGLRGRLGDGVPARASDDRDGRGDGVRAGGSGAGEWGWRIGRGGGSPPSRGCRGG